MPASSPSLLVPKGHQGDMGSQIREPALSVAFWLSWGAALGAVACAMALMTQQTELQTLRREVTRLQRTGGPSEKGEGYPWLKLQEQVSEGRRCLEEKNGWQGHLWASWFHPPSLQSFKGVQERVSGLEVKGAAIPGKEIVKD